MHLFIKLKAAVIICVATWGKGNYMEIKTLTSSFYNVVMITISANSCEFAYAENIENIRRLFFWSCFFGHHKALCHVKSTSGYM